MSSPRSKNHKSGSVVGVTFDEGVILACTMPSYLIYYLDNRIYCCATNAPIDREPLTDVANKLQSASLKSAGVMVRQALDAVSKKYEKSERAQLLVAGEDVSGVHLVTIQAFGVQTAVCFAAQGDGATEAFTMLQQEWQAQLGVRDAEKLVRKVLNAVNMHRAKVDLCIIFRRQT